MPPTLRERVDDSVDSFRRWIREPENRTRCLVGGSVALIAIAVIVGGFAISRSVRSGANSVPDERSVVLYSSVDDALLRQVIASFEETTKIKVRVVGDTEATKTTGLVQRLITERNSPRADVWWSNETMGSVKLASEGVLEPFTSKAEMDFDGGWPKHLRDPKQQWYGFAQRARVIAYNTNRVSKQGAPVRLRDLAKPEWRGRIGMARPQFGTTRNQMAALYSLAGAEPFRAWLEGLKDNNVRFFDGNSAVVQALGNGEIEACLTDTDDCYAAKRENWPVEFSFEIPDPANRQFPASTPPALAFRSFGPLMLPNSAGRVRGTKRPTEASKLLDFILSEKVERMLAESEARNIPIRAGLLKQVKDLPKLPEPAPVDWSKIAAADEAAQKVVGEVFGEK